MLTYGDRRKEISGGEPATTNNRMELLAAIRALESLKEPCAIELFSDSVYVRSGITKWVAGWKRKGWRTVNKAPVKNDDLWRALDAAAARHQITWRWLKGHAGHALNERCDELANAEIARIRKRFSAEELAQQLAAFQTARVVEPDEAALL